LKVVARSARSKSIRGSVTHAVNAGKDPFAHAASSPLFLRFRAEVQNRLRNGTRRQYVQRHRKVSVSELFGHHHACHRRAMAPKAAVFLRDDALHQAELPAGSDD